MQDSAHNFGRVRPTEDHLQSATEPFALPKRDEEDLDNGEEDAESNDCPYLQGVDLDTFLDTFEQNLSTEQQQTALKHGIRIFFQRQ